MTSEYRQRKSSTTNKFAMASIQREIDDMEEECLFDVERQCDLRIPGPRDCHPSATGAISPDADRAGAAVPDVEVHK
jgi:hypothetical protein